MTINQHSPIQVSEEDAQQAQAALGIDPQRIPRHIAIIMDGNGRWASQRSQPRIEGHRQGADVVREIVTEAGKLGIEVLTLYSFSSENWKRPREEIDALMSLLLEYLAAERDELVRNNVKFIQIGRREGLPQTVLAQLDETIAATQHCTGLTLALALNYGARIEITDAVQKIAAKVSRGELAIEDISEETISEHLYTAEIIEPDLLIRTAGEHRISNYLLWQISYAEIYFTDVLWPDFSADDLHIAIRDYAQRERRFGAVQKSQ